jgi:hypothetical protein
MNGFVILFAVLLLSSASSLTQALTTEEKAALADMVSAWPNLATHPDGPWIIAEVDDACNPAAPWFGLYCDISDNVEELYVL